MADTKTTHPVPERDAAAYVGFKQPTMRKWRREGTGPAYLRIGRAVRYRIADLDRFLDESLVSPRSTLETRGR